MAGLADGLTRYLTAVASGLPASNDSPLAAGLRSAGAAASAGSYARGLSDYLGAEDEAVKQSALQQMASVNPTATANFITKQKLFGSVSDGLKGEFGSLLKYRSTLSDDDPQAKLIDLRLGVLGKDPTQNRTYQYEGEFGKGQAKLGYEPQLVGEKKKEEKEVELSYNPKIKEAEKSAEEGAKYISETEQTKKMLERNMPSLIKTVDELEKLSETATYTKSGQAYNAARRELGLPPTQGAIDREKYNSIIKNELLPKLNEIFRGAISDSEREALLTTMGDVNKSPAERKAILNAFIEAKQRQLQSYSGETKTEDDPLGLR